MSLQARLGFEGLPVRVRMKLCKGSGSFWILCLGFGVWGSKDWGLGFTASGPTAYGRKCSKHSPALFEHGFGVVGFFRIYIG